METTLTAVLTGDLIGSTHQTADRVDDAMSTIRIAANAIAAWHIPPDDTRFTRNRGDGWQIVVRQPAFALRAAVVIQAKLIAIGMESRISIGIGEVTSLGTANLADAAGTAFEISGKQLDTMGNTWRLTISRTNSPASEDGLIADLLGERMGKWTAAQAEAAAIHMASPSKIVTLHEIAEKLGISPQAVNDRIRGAGCNVVRSVLQRWEGLRMRASPESQT
jgi:hypothetical protein